MLALDPAGVAVATINRDEIASAIRVIRPQGTLLLVCIDPKQIRDPQGRTFSLPDQLDAAVTWAVERNEAGWGMYFTPNVANAVVHKKAAKGDMTSGVMMWTDADPDVLMYRGYDGARAHLLRRLYPELEASASLIIDSGNGLQAFWRLAHPVDLQHAEKRAHYEALNDRVGKLFDGPSTHNCDRVMRLPGTINYPNATKLAHGYPREPRQARLLHFSDRTYTLGEIEALMLRRQFDLFLDGNSHARQRYDGHADGLRDASGSGRDMSMVRMLKTAGFSLNEIIALLKSWPHGSKEGRAQGFRYWQRMYDKPLPDDAPPAAPVIDLPRDPSRLRPLTVDDLLAQPSQGWLIRGVLPKNGLGLVYGQSGSGKSFLTLDLCGCILRGRPWYGQRVTTGNIIYIAGEGHLRNRLRAYMSQHAVAPAELSGLRIINTHLNLRDPKADLLDLLRELQDTATELGGVALVVIDTLNSVMGAGDENESSDMGAMIEAARKIGTATNASVLYVHHSGKDETRGARGHSSLKGALDAELYVKREEHQRTVTLTKVKEGEDGKEFVFALQPIDLGPSTDPDADPDERDSSCAVIQIHDQPEPRKPTGRPKTGVQLIAIDALQQTIAEYGQPLPSTSVIPSGKRGVRVDLWRTRFYAIDPTCSDPETGKDARRKRFQRAFDDLYKCSQIGSAGGHVWLKK
jgi:archaellum biogenesis ATPase FlaH